MILKLFQQMDGFITHLEAEEEDDEDEQEVDSEFIVKKGKKK